jgi:hypothetical protein
VCARRLGENAVKAADLYDELALVLKVIGRGRSSSKPGSGMPPRDAVVEMRSEIRHVLVSWVKLICEERAFKYPADDVHSIAEFVSRHSQWLAATEYAGEAADELASLASRAWGLAYPNGTRLAHVGPCPLCDGELTAIVRATDATLPSQVVCSATESHLWPADRWRVLDRLVQRKRAMA